MLQCKHCGFQATTEEEESSIHIHHIIPKSIGGTDIDGRLALCKKCHDILHNMLPKLMWAFVTDKENCKNAISGYVLNFYKKY